MLKLLYCLAIAPVLLPSLTAGPADAQVPVFDEIFIDGEPILEPPGGRPIEPEEVPLPGEDQDVRPVRPDNPPLRPPTPPDAFTPNSPVRQQPNPFQFRPQSTAPLDTAYTLDGGDVLQINVFDVPEYSGQYSVLADGTINLPLLGLIDVRGLSVDEVNNLLTEAYRTYLVRPFVNVTLIAARPMNLIVSGEVSRPGAYISTAPSTRQFPTVTDALELADGVTLAADIRNVELRRQTRRGEQFYVLNLWELVQNGDAAQDVTLRDGDSIFVPTATLSNAFDTQVLLKASFAPDEIAPIPVAISGEVNRPGTYVVTPGNLTTAPQPPTITQAIATAGGIKPTADIRNVRVRRRDRQGQEILLDINLWALLQEGDIIQDVPLQPNDAIIIPRAEVISPEDALLLANTSFSPDEIRVAVVGEVVSPGRLALTPDTTLNQAILAAGGFNNTRAKKSSIDLLRLNPDGTVTNRRIDLDFTAGLNAEDNPLMRNGDVVVVNRNAFTGATDVLSALLSPIGEVFSVLNFFRAFGFIQVDN